MSNEPQQLLGPLSRHILSGRAIEDFVRDHAAKPPHRDRISGLPAHKLVEWQWLMRPPWRRPFQRRRYDKKIAEGGIGCYCARFEALPASAWRLREPMVFLYRRPSLWRRLVWKLEKRRIERAPESPSDQETKETK